MATDITRPALVIGLGGTGQWILTFLKKDLLEYNQGVMPSNVKLLAFDTISQPEAKESGASAGDSEEVQIGGIGLEPNDEFIHLGEKAPDIFPWAESIASQDKYAHLAEWFQAKEYMQTLPSDAFNLSTGAGAIRQFGRMAIINDLSNTNESAIWNRIRNEMKKIKGGTGAANKLEVIIVGSFAGGTGAGMFIDMAVLLREIVHGLSAQNKFIVRGFFVLPSAFGLSGVGDKDLKMQARSFAAWRELDRFMIKSPNSGVRNIQYHFSHNKLKAIPVNKRPFDACYLIDSHRSSNSLSTVSPQEGIYPSVADVISAILDPVAGKHYTEHITTNLADIYVQNPGVPMYSAVGSYTLKVPVYYTMEEITHLFAVDTLNTWLEPIADNKQRITKISATKNEEEGVGTPGLEGALPFIQKTSVTQGEITVNATQFLNHIANIVDEEEIKRGKLVTRYANTKGAQRNLLLFTNLGDGKNATQIKSQIQSVLEQRLAHQVPISREVDGKEDPRDGIGRIEKGAHEFLKKRFGRRLDDGTETRGEYGDALSVCRHYQRNRFREFLAMYVQNTLMGETESDPRRARRGKLGYIYDLVNQLVAIFDIYIGFLNDVEDKRQEGGKSQDIYTKYDKERNNMRDISGSRILFGIFPAPKAHKAQETFIRAGQARADMRRDDLLLASAQEAAKDLRSASIEMRDKLYDWITTLAVGSEEDPSLYQQVYKNLNLLRQGRDRDAALDKVQNVLGQEKELYVKDIEALQNILRRIKWTVKDEVEMRANEELHKFALECVFLKDEDTLSMQANNMRSIVFEWLASCRKEYEYIPSQQRIADVLVEKYGKNGSRELAEEIKGKAEPLWQPDRAGIGAKARHSFIRVFHKMEDTNDDDAQEQITIEGRKFLDNFAENLGQLDASANLKVEMVNSADHYKLSLIRSDDCIPSNNFEVWHTLKDAYIEYIQLHSNTERQERDAVMLHTFPAECNIAEFESRWAAKGKVYEIFAPEVVAVMTKKERVKLFFLAYAAGIIKSDRSEHAMMLDLSTETEKKKNHFALNVDRDGTTVNDFFKSMDTFVNYGKDARKTEDNVIPYDDIRPYIISKENSSDETFLEFLEKQADEETSVVYSDLMERFKETKEEKYAQLARIAQFIFEDELQTEKTWENV